MECILENEKTQNTQALATIFRNKLSVKRNCRYKVFYKPFLGAVSLKRVGLPPEWTRMRSTTHARTWSSGHWHSCPICMSADLCYSQHRSKEPGARPLCLLPPSHSCQQALWKHHSLYTGKERTAGLTGETLLYHSINSVTVFGKRPKELLTWKLIFINRKDKIILTGKKHVNTTHLFHE